VYARDIGLRVVCADSTNTEIHDDDVQGAAGRVCRVVARPLLPPEKPRAAEEPEGGRKTHTQRWKQQLSTQKTWKAWGKEWAVKWNNLPDLDGEEADGDPRVQTPVLRVAIPDVRATPWMTALRVCMASARQFDVHTREIVMGYLWPAVPPNRRGLYLVTMVADIVLQNTKKRIGAMIDKKAEIFAGYALGTKAYEDTEARFAQLECVLNAINDTKVYSFVVLNMVVRTILYASVKNNGQKEAAPDLRSVCPLLFGHFGELSSENSSYIHTLYPQFKWTDFDGKRPLFDCVCPLLCVHRSQYKWDLPHNSGINPKWLPAPKHPRWDQLNRFLFPTNATPTNAPTWRYMQDLEPDNFARFSAMASIVAAVANHTWGDSKLKFLSSSDLLGDFTLCPNDDPSKPTNQNRKRRAAPPKIDPIAAAIRKVTNETMEEGVGATSSDTDTKEPAQSPQTKRTRPEVKHMPTVEELLQGPSAKQPDQDPVYTGRDALCDDAGSFLQCVNSMLDAKQLSKLQATLRRLRTLCKQPANFNRCANAFHADLQTLVVSATRRLCTHTPRGGCARRITAH
jgi:hypothetical protein